MLLWFSAVVLAAGVFLVLNKVVGGSDPTRYGNQEGFVARLPEKQIPLTNSRGDTVKTFQQLDPKVRSTIRTFLESAVAREHLERSWGVVSPSMRRGYTFNEWKTATELPIVPYPKADVATAEYYLDYASTREILIEVGLSQHPSVPFKQRTRPVAFQLGLTPYGKGVNTRWLVSYWMPRWTPPLPIN